MGPDIRGLDGAFLEELSDGVVDVLSRAAMEGRGFGQMLLGLSNGVVARIPMTATAYPLRTAGHGQSRQSHLHRRLPESSHSRRAATLGD